MKSSICSNMVFTGPRSTCWTTWLLTSSTLSVNIVSIRVDSSDRPGRSRGFRILTEFISMTGRLQICDCQEISEMIVPFQNTKSLKKISFKLLKWWGQLRWTLLSSSGVATNPQQTLLQSFCESRHCRTPIFCVTVSTRPRNLVLRWPVSRSWPIY